MKIKRVVNEKSGVVVCERCAIADSMWTRGRGLLGRKSLDESEGILLSPGNSIHMFGMKFSIDVLFLTREFVIADMVENIAPGKAYVAKSHGGKPHAALEIAAGQIANCGAQIGDQLRLEDVE